MNESPGALELLASRVDELEKRVRALEHPEEGRTNIAVAQTAQSGLDRGAGTSALETGNLFPIIGRAMLGVAGAYVLRAVAEAGVLPRMPISALAVGYAFAWLVWPSRTGANLARFTYAGTSALILASLLWENTLKFHVFGSIACAGVLAAFLTVATVLALQDYAKTRSMWVAQSIAVLTAAVLAFTTRAVLPFITALLIAVLVSEMARMRQFAQPAWALTVLVTDAAVWAMIFIYAGPQDARAVYPELSAAALIAPACVLFAVNASSVAVRAIRHQSRISFFDAFQIAIAFLLAVGSVLYFASQAGRTMMGIVCLVLSACLYLATFRYFRPRDERRNLRVFSAWSAALLMAGSLWALPRLGAIIVLAIAAVAAIYSARRTEPGILELHGAAFLLSAMAVSGLPRYIFDALIGSLPNAPAVAIWIVSLSAALSTLLTRRAAESAWQNVLQLVPPLLAVSALIALLVHGVVTRSALIVAPDAHHVAFLRTFTICLAALALAFGGARSRHAELTHLAYAALAFVAAKLLFEDLRHGHMEFIAASIALFAIALITAPRLVRLGTRLRGFESEITAEDSSLPYLPL